MVEIFRKRNYLCVRIFLSKTLVKRCFLAGNKGQSQMHAHYRGHFMTLQNSSGSLHRTFCAQNFYNVVFRFGEMFGRNSYGISYSNSERVWTHWITLKFLRWWMVPITPHHLDLEGVTKLRHEEALFKFFAAPKLNFRTPFYGVVTNELFCCSKHGRRCLVSDVAACFRDHP